MNYTTSTDSKVWQWQQFFFDAYRAWGPYYAAAYEDLLLYSGSSWTPQERTKLQQQGRMILELPKVRRILNLYSGYERENRTQTVAAPVESSDDITADLMSEVMYYVYEKGNADYITSEAFDHSNKTGMSIMGIYMDYSKDKVNGDIKFFWKPYNAIMLDPYFTKRDLSDCDQASSRDLLSKEQIHSLCPWLSEQEIERLPTGIRDNKYQYLGVYKQFNSSYISRNLCTYDQYWRRINKSQKFLVDKETGVSQEWNGTPQEEREIQQLIRRYAPQLELINSTKRSVELNIIIGGQLVYEGPEPTGLDTFPFVPCLAYFEPLISVSELKVQGVVRSIKDAQRQYNRRHSQLIDLMESVLNNGYIVRNGAVLDPSMLYQAGQGKQIVLNEGYDVNTDIREISPPNIPPGWLSYQGILDENIMEIPGGSDELLGLSKSGDSQVSGRLAEVRASNGLKGNRGLFDNLEQTKKYVGKLVIEAIQKNYTPGKIYRITKKEPTEEFFSSQFGEYDAVVKQAIKTATQQEAYYYQLIELVQMGAPIPWSEILANAPAQGKTQLIELVKANEEQERQRQQMLMEQERINHESTMAQTEQSIALAQERRARVLSDIGLARERISESEQNYAKALLDNAKTVSEIKDIDNRRLVDILEMATAISQEAHNKAEEQLDLDIETGEALKQK